MTKTAKKPTKKEAAKKAAAQRAARRAKEASRKEDLFIREYLVDLNATQAALRAGFSERSAGQIGHNLLQNERVRDAIDRAMADRASAIGIHATSVLSRLVAEANADLADIYNPDGSLKPIHDWPLVWRRGLVSGIEVEQLFAGTGDQRQQVGTVTKLKISDRVKRIELIGRHTQVSAFKDKVEHDIAPPVKRLFEQIAGAAIRPRPAAEQTGEKG